MALAAPAVGQLAPYRVESDAIPLPLAATGDAARGREVVLNRESGACFLCHAMPEGQQAGNIAPPLAGVGARLNPGQLRLRVVDSTRVNPDTPMPAYYRIEGLTQVAAAWRGKPILSAQQVEDVVAWLSTLKEPPR